ncbi:MAG: DUF3795 domain-containing protein [Candidatus Thorarchaeota archaeon]|nr:MAG: DUF3795 domain-containing protein [Candidatus Thorarchaeota archaeon]
MRDPRDLTSYCGLYCPGCTRFEGRLAEQRTSPQDIADRYRVIREDPSHDRAQTAHAGDTLDGVRDTSAGHYQSCKGCKEGGGKNDCQVRSCASDRGYSTCVECIRMEFCDVLSGNPESLPRLREIRDKGYDGWLKTKEEMVKTGWTFNIDLD